MQFKDLLQEHDYYCSDNNYYSKDAGKDWSTFKDFYEEFKDADIDMNLIFRLDIKEKGPLDFYMEIFMIQQRKGIFIPHHISSVNEADFDNIKLLLQPHLDKLASLWQPFSFPNKIGDVQN